MFDIDDQRRQLIEYLSGNSVRGDCDKMILVGRFSARMMPSNSTLGTYQFDGDGSFTLQRPSETDRGFWKLQEKTRLLISEADPSREEFDPVEAYFVYSAQNTTAVYLANEDASAVIELRPVGRL